MHYRTAELSDLEDTSAALRALADEQREVGSRIDTAASMPAFRDQLARRLVDDGVIVAEAEGELAGFVSFGPQRDAFVRTTAVGFIEYLYVGDPYRKQGVGSELLRRAEAALRERGMTVVELEVFEENDAATDFYRRAGYRRHRSRFSKSLDANGGT